MLFGATNVGTLDSILQAFKSIFSFLDEFSVLNISLKIWIVIFLCFAVVLKFIFGGGSDDKKSQKDN